MKLLKSALIGLLVGAIFIWPAAAQWQVPLNSVPIGTGAGTGFKSAGPGTSGQLLLGVTGSPPNWAALSQDCTVTSAGVLTCLKSNNVAFGQLATAAVTPVRAGDVAYWNGASWTTLAGNNAGTGVFTENSSGAPSWTVLSNVTTPHAIPGGRLCLQMSGCLGGVSTLDVAAAASKVIIITSGTTWTVPLDFTAVNAIETFGAGGGGGGALAAGSTGGGGGAYSKATNQTLTPGATVTVHVAAGGTAGAASGGSGGLGGDSYLCNTLVTNCATLAGTAVISGAQGGQGGVPPGSAVLGGASTSGVGSTKFSGGNSGTGGGTSSGGAGGAAGPSGAGGVGANGSGTVGGAGGTANNGTVAGGAANSAGIQSGTIETETLTGITVKVGSGAGGSSSGGTAGACAAFGGGGGGGANLNGAGQAGCAGGIVVTYTPAASVITFSPCAGYVPNCAGLDIPVYNGSNTILSQFTSSPTDTTGLSLQLTTADNTSGNCYDVFAGLNATVLTMGTGPAWSSCAAGSSARGSGAGTTQLQMFNGFLTNAVTATIRFNGSSFSCPANQCTYLGTIHMALSGQVSAQINPPAMSGGPNSEVGLYNAFNRVRIHAKGQDSTSSWTYNLVTARSANGSASNAITVLDGLGVERMHFGYWASVTGPAVWAGTPELTLNQTCASAISGGGGQGALVTQTAGGTSTDGGPSTSYYDPAPLLGLTKMNACDGAVNASLTVFGNDFMQYWVDYNF